MDSSVDSHTKREPGLIEFSVPQSLEGERLDRAISFASNLPRSIVATLIGRGKVSVNGVPVMRRSKTLSCGQIVEVDTADVTTDTARADLSVQFECIYFDQHIAVINKPAGLVVHHGAGHSGGTLVDGLLARFDILRDNAVKGALDAARPGIVHRLDKETSGLMVVGLTPQAVERLAEQISARNVTRQYTALVAGIIPEDNGVVDAPVGRSSRNPLNMCVSSSGKPAITRYRVVRRYTDPIPLSLLEVHLETGRTHQIRVHMSSIGHSVAGDVRYGGTSWSVLPSGVLPGWDADAGRGAGKDASAGHKEAMTQEGNHPPRIFLHASRLSIEHPSTGESMDWSVSLPLELSSVLDALDARCDRS